jgi:AraC family transcriptional regulator
MRQFRSKARTDPGRLLGPEVLAASFGSLPLRSSECYGWKDLSVSSWRTKVDCFDFELPDLLVSLHHEGPVYKRDGHRWDPSPSVPGQVTFMPPGSSGIFRRGGILGVTTVNLSIERLERLLGSRATRDWLSSVRMQFAFVDGFLSSTIAALANELYSPSERGSLYADTLADALAIHLVQISSRRAEIVPPRRRLSGPALQRVCDRIEADLGGELSIAELAREAHLSPYHFSRAFKEATGLPPHSYLTARRIEHAKELLATSEMPMSEIALEVGFSSQAHLTDCFHRLVGVTPREFRRRSSS